ncbi:hypothetical protein MTX35_11625 [Rhodococcus sp. ARC_M12]|uniref:hypothetical protein n=1 Tax=Rhodococcus sp. ARC_M12 TaxID=2928854 RepID=UPI001FB204D4|nr:hypothetical protein [Rhodococcus sp. ARC_M12]MCJ0978357.1 hypothetical protein [Rhodococcus sp. ARC_M12]
MRVLLSAESFAAVTGRSFEFHWKREHNFSADIADLWIYERERVGFLGEALACRRFPVFDSVEGYSQVASSKKVVVKGQHALDLSDEGTPWPELFQNLRPTDEIIERVSKFCRQYLQGAPFVGVMVRAHKKSHSVTKVASPPSWFVARMHELRQSNPDVLFFLSCDDPAVQHEICKAVPNVIAQPKESRYNSSGGVKDAVVDLYLLSLSSYIIGPHWSSFVDMALALSRNPEGFETSRTSAKDTDFELLCSSSSDLLPWLEV